MCEAVGHSTLVYLVSSYQQGMIDWRAACCVCFSRASTSRIGIAVASAVRRVVTRYMIRLYFVFDLLYFLVSET